MEWFAGQITRPLVRSSAKKTTKDSYKKWGFWRVNQYKLLGIGLEYKKSWKVILNKRRKISYALVRRVEVIRKSNDLSEWTQLKKSFSNSEVFLIYIVVSYIYNLRDIHVTVYKIIDLVD